LKIENAVNYWIEKEINFQNSPS
ncbi:MAG: hypothetical protein RL440_2036, partial [Bacteroidota bacterium]